MAADKSKDRLELFLEETLRSLEENGIESALKNWSKEGDQTIVWKKDLLAVLTAGYGKSLNF